MFDTMKVAEEIKTARIAKNMTQVNLADLMGVSYQAVSNWERGNSMPDIGKLDELCGILDISFDQLLGSEQQAQKIQKVMKYSGDNSEVNPSLEELRDVAPLMPPKALNEIAGDIEIDLGGLIGLAPFLTKAAVNRLAEKISTEDIDLCMLCGLAPFVDSSTLDKLTRNVETVDLSELIGLAPFLDRGTVNRLAEKIPTEDIDLCMLNGLAPFVDREILQRLLQEAQ